MLILPLHKTRTIPIMAGFQSEMVRLLCLLVLCLFTLEATAATKPGISAPPPQPSSGKINKKSKAKKPPQDGNASGLKSGTKDKKSGKNSTSLLKSKSKSTLGSNKGDTGKKGKENKKQSLSAPKDLAGSPQNPGNSADKNSSRLPTGASPTLQKRDVDSLNKAQPAKSVRKNKSTPQSEEDLSFDDYEPQTSNWIWLVPFGFFGTAGGLYLFQKYQHLLIKGVGVQENSPPESVRPESRAEVAFGSVLASLDLDSARAEDSKSRNGIKIVADKKDKHAYHPDDQQHTAQNEAREDGGKTRISSSKTKSLGTGKTQQNFSEARPQSDSLPPPPERTPPTPKNREMVPMEAVLESLETKGNIPKLDTQISTVHESTGQQAAPFLASPPSAMNWVSPFEKDTAPEESPTMQIKQASGYQNALNKRDPKNKKP